MVWLDLKFHSDASSVECDWTQQGKLNDDGPDQFLGSQRAVSGEILNFVRYSAKNSATRVAVRPKSARS